VAQRPVPARTWVAANLDDVIDEVHGPVLAYALRCVQRGLQARVLAERRIGDLECEQGRARMLVRVVCVGTTARSGSGMEYSSSATGDWTRMRARP
jgi:hypothetical protein